MRVSRAAAVTMLLHHGVASFAPTLPFHRQRTRLFMEPPMGGEKEQGEELDWPSNTASEQDNFVIGGSTMNMTTATGKRKTTASSASESDFNVVNGDGGRKEGDPAGVVERPGFFALDISAQASSEVVQGYDDEIRITKTPAIMNGNEAGRAVDGEVIIANNLDDAGNVSSEIMSLSKKRYNDDGDGAVNSKRSTLSRYAISEGVEQQLKNEAPPSTPFFASVDIRKESPQISGRSLSEGNFMQEKKQANTSSVANERDVKTKTETTVSQTNLLVKDNSAVDGGVFVERNEPTDIDVNGTVGTILKIQSTGAETNNAVRDNEERKRRYIEYKSTSMEQLRQDVDKAKFKSTEAKERVAAMQQRVDELQKELVFAEDEFQKYLAIKEEESESIASRVGELESLIQAREDKQRKEEDTVRAAGKASHNKLLKEIEEKKFALRQAKEELNEEVEASIQIQSRLDQTTAQGNAEKAAFQNDEAKLKVMIKEQRKKVARAQAQIQEERDLFEEERISLGKMLQKQITRVAETNARLQLEQSMFGMNQVEIQRNIDDITSKLRAAEEEIQAEKEKSVKETSELRSTVRKLRQMLTEANDKLESKQTLSRKIQEDLEMKSIFEKVKAQNLATELESQRMRYRQEIKDLETEFAANRRELDEAEALLESTRAAHLRETNMLKDQIAGSERIRKLKAKQMSQRFRDIRTELTGLWQEERRRGRQDQKELHEKYSKRLLDLQEAVPQLERKVMEARQLTKALRVNADKVMKERASVMEEGRLAEMRYIQAKHDRNVAISALENELEMLYDDIAERDEKLASYRSSLRVLLRLSVKLLRERIRAARKRLFSQFRRRQKSNSQEIQGTAGQV